MSKNKTESNPLIEFFDIAQKHGININDIHALVMLPRAKKESGDGIYHLFSYINLEKAGYLTSGLQYTEKANVVLNDLLSLFKPMGKKEVKVDVPDSMVDRYNTTFPCTKIPTSGKYARCNGVELKKSFEWFLQTYPNYTWDIILDATALYVREKEQEGYMYMRTAKYFLRKQDANKVWSSDLADFCERIINGDESEELPKFHTKVI